MILGKSGENSGLRSGRSRADQAHDLQLHRELESINLCVARELGPLPLGGLPVQPKRKPDLPRPVPSRPAQSQEDESMSLLDTLLGRNVETEAITYANCAYHRDHPPAMSDAEVQAYCDRVLQDALVNEPNFDKYVEKHGMPKLWPLQFKNFSFYGGAFNVKACRIIYGNAFFREWNEPPLPPEPGWMDNWRVHWVNAYLPFPKLDVQWTSLDGDVHKVILDLEKMLRKREVLHKVPVSDMPDNWLIGRGEKDDVHLELLLEVNDRTLRLYMASPIAIKIEHPTEEHRHDFRKDWVLAWTKDY